jgi:hypothetical protein
MPASCANSGCGARAELLRSRRACRGRRAGFPRRAPPTRAQAGGWAPALTRSVERLVKGGRAGSPRARTRTASARSRSLASSERRAAEKTARTAINDVLHRPATSAVHSSESIPMYSSLTAASMRSEQVFRNRTSVQKPDAGSLASVDCGSSLYASRLSVEPTRLGWESHSGRAVVRPGGHPLARAGSTPSRQRQAGAS